MAFRRRSYKRKPRRSHKRRASRRLSKHMVRAIKAISQQPVETKRFPFSADISTLLNASGYVAGASWIVRGNVFSDIPRFKDTSTPTEQSFIGNDIQARGFRWMINVYSNGVTPAPDLLYRFTVYTVNAYTSGISGLLPTSLEFDQAFTNTPTWSTWNPQYVKIKFRRMFRLNRSSTDPGMLHKKFWVPLRRKITSSEQESLLVNSFMAQIKGEQMYWALEMFGPGLADIRSDSLGRVDTALFFKDA